MGGPFIVALVIVGPLLLFIVLIAIAERHRRWLDQHGEIVSATVTGIKRKWGEEGGRYYVVTAQWTDPRTGSICTFRERRNRRPQYSEGSHIQVVINQSKPGDYAIKG